MSETRVDYLINAFINGEDVSNFECRSRIESYLKNCCMCESCNDLEPKTRTEFLLHKLANDLANGTSPYITKTLGGDY